jgi:MFS family permease
MVLDTTSINFGIAKLSQAWSNAAPHLQNLSDKYVKFVVAKAVLIPCVLFLPTIICIFLFCFFLKKLPDWDEGAIPGVLIFVVAVLGVTVGFFVSGYDAALALWSPEMFTINSIIGAGK